MGGPPPHAKVRPAEASRKPSTAAKKATTPSPLRHLAQLGATRRLAGVLEGSTRYGYPHPVEPTRKRRVGATRSTLLSAFVAPRAQTRAPTLT